MHFLSCRNTFVSDAQAQSKTKTTGIQFCRGIQDQLSNYIANIFACASKIYKPILLRFCAVPILSLSNLCDKNPVFVSYIDDPKHATNMDKNQTFDLLMTNLDLVVFAINELWCDTNWFYAIFFVRPIAPIALRGRQTI